MIIYIYINDQYNWEKKTFKNDKMKGLDKKNM